MFDVQTMYSCKYWLISIQIERYLSMYTYFVVQAIIIWLCSAQYFKNIFFSGNHLNLLHYLLQDQVSDSPGHNHISCWWT